MLCNMLGMPVHSWLWGLEVFGNEVGERKSPVLWYRDGLIWSKACALVLKTNQNMPSSPKVLLDCPCLLPLRCLFLKGRIMVSRLPGWESSTQCIIGVVENWWVSVTERLKCSSCQLSAVLMSSEPLSGRIQPAMLCHWAFRVVSSLI